MNRLLFGGVLALGFTSLAHAGNTIPAVFTTVDGVAGGTLRAFLGTGTHQLIAKWTPFPLSVRTEMRFVVTRNAPGLGAIMTPKNPAGTFQFNVLNLESGQFGFRDNFTHPDFRHGVFPATIRLTTHGNVTGLILGADGSNKITLNDGEIVAVYPVWFRGGVRVAAGDVTGDGVDEIICAPGPGANLPILVLDAMNADVIAQFYPYGRTFGGGVNVAVGDVNGDGAAEIVTAPSSGMGPQVRVFSSAGVLKRSFNAFESSFTGGVRVAVGDIDGDLPAEIVTGNGPGRNPQIRAFGATGLLWSKSFMPATSRAGIQVSILPFMPGN